MPVNLGTGAGPSTHRIGRLHNGQVEDDAVQVDMPARRPRGAGPRGPGSDSGPSALVLPRRLRRIGSAALHPPLLAPQPLLLGLYGT